ncbi:bifunctional homocysteine S-methyltransferase/methylenetetrahydrofolate reductase [Leptolinea tardivitalis]|nr:bifunctional homocysteine S-methyltransferase/methylenetetrahydrofolate reductase [Leptolinea tardivitalis]GAP21100.1 methionine synthase I [Leptolinea tardivitalis]
MLHLKEEPAGRLTRDQLIHLTFPLLSDGAMGTMLHQKGVSFDACFDELNITNPSIVGEIHRDYIEAGSQIIQTNTFGANCYKLARFGLGNRVKEINTAGVDLARRVIQGTFKEILIAGDIGPLGVRLAPYGRVQPEEARLAFTEQISALLDAGVDLLLIETMTDLQETRLAVKVARSLNQTIPIIASMTFTRDDRTLLGDSPSIVARTLINEGADLTGVNCSGGPQQILRILRQMHAAIPNGKFSVMPNAGWPEQVGGRIMYAATPEYFGDYAVLFHQNGARIIGGCCGTTPEHISAMKKALSKAVPLESAEPFEVSEQEPEFSRKEEALAPTKFGAKISAGKFVTAVEMDPPRGLATQKLIAGASLLAEAGVDVINVADSPMARMRMSPWAVCSLIQQKVGIETVLHFPTRGRNLIRVQGDLLAAHALDVRNVFVVMGDPTSIGDYPDAMDNYDLVPSGLIKLIKQGFNTGIDHSGANIGQPTNFFVGCALNLTPNSPADEIKNLARKIKAGADFALTQPVFQPEAAREFINRIKNEMGEFNLPILGGVLPLANTRHANFLDQEVPGIIIPPSVLERMRKAGEKSSEEGVKIAVELIEELRPLINGAYIMPAFNRYDLVAEVVEAIKE